MTQRVLYIEDELDYQILVRRILRRAGLEVETADTLVAGLHRLAEARPRLLILDINLPDGDGYTACRQLRADPAFQDLPILMLTVRRRPEEWLRGFASGADDYISKPLNPPELIDRVVGCLEARGTRSLDHANAEFRLIRAAVAGNPAAFQALIEKYRQRLLDSMRPHVNRPEDAEDVVAFAFARAYESLPDFRGEASFFTWLYRIAINAAGLMNRRSAHVSLDELTKGDDVVLPPALALPDAVQDVDDRLAGEQVHRLLERVPPSHRKLLELFYVRNLRYEDISRRQRIPLGTVMSRLHKARQLLHEAWSSEMTATR